MYRFRPILALATLLALAPLASADDRTDAIDEALKKPILGKDQSTAEVRDFIEARIVAMPAPSTREQWQHDAEQLRQQALKEVILRGEAARWDAEPLRSVWYSAISGPGYRMWKLRYEAIPGLWVPAILYEPERFEGRIPVVLNVNGHDAQGKAADYKQIRCINQAKRGMLALNVEWFGMGQLKGEGFRHGLINAVDLCGTSGIALHYEMLRRGIDVLLSHPSADPARVAVTGLSGGGWQTMLISGLDPRVTLANPVAGFASYHTRNQYLADLGDSEQTPSDLATVLDPQHLVALRAPRATLLTFNARDTCCYVASRALPPLLEAAGPVYRLLGASDRLTSHINEDPGDHNYGLDNRLAFYRALNDVFAEPGEPYPTHELPFEGELKSEDELKVELPEENLDFGRVAASLAKDLPREAIGEQGDFTKKRLRNLVRIYDPPATRNVRSETGAGADRVAAGTFRIGTSWTVPFTEFGPPDAGVVLLLADAGRGSQAERVGSLLAAGRRVVAIDPFSFGESKLPERDYLFAILVACVGERPLGIQAGQLVSIARLLNEEQPQVFRLSLFADGPRTSTIALVAAAVEWDEFDKVTCRKPLGSLKLLIEQATDVSEMPELFCFGLLQEFDVASLAGLCAPRTVSLVEPDDRAIREFAPIVGVTVAVPAPPPHGTKP